MELSKYVPPDFEVGDVILTTNLNRFGWAKAWENHFVKITDIDWHMETLRVIFIEDKHELQAIFKDFNKSIIKKSNKLLKLVL